MMEKYKILIVEDDVDLREGLSFSFSGDGYDVTETGMQIPAHLTTHSAKSWSVFPDVTERVSASADQ